MFVFGHAGLTLGAAILLTVIFSRDDKQTTGKKEYPELPEDLPGPAIFRKSPATVIRSRLTSLADRIDIRILLIGSLLPDIIDKPIGRIIFRDYFHNGRIFSHTLLFLIIITAGGVILYRINKKTWPMVLAFGTFTHLILDGMWLIPHTFLWPLYGFSFGKDTVSVWPWIASLLHHLSTEPWGFIPEIAGAVITAWFVWQLVQRKKLLAFLRYGRI